MPVITIKKTRKLRAHANKKTAIRYLVAHGRNPSDYEFLYVYKEQRTVFASSYQELHRKAALRSYHKNKTTTRPVGRPRKTDGDNQW